MSGSVRETKSFLEELLARFFQTCTDSVIVCAGCGGMFGSVKGMKFYFLCFFFDINVIRNRVMGGSVRALLTDDNAADKDSGKSFAKCV